MFGLQMGRMGLVGGGGLSLAAQIAAMYAAGEQGAWYDPSDWSTLTQDSAGTLPVTAVGQPVGRTLDKSGRGNTQLQATAINRPLIQQTASVWQLAFNGTNSSISSGAIALGANMDCFIAVRRDSTAPFLTGYPINAGSTFFGATTFGGGTPASAGSGAPTYAVNGVDVAGGTATTRGQLHDAMPSGVWLVLEVRNLNLTTWTAFAFGGYNSFTLNGAVGGIILCPAQSLENRTKARRYLGQKVGLSL